MNGGIVFRIGEALHFVPASVALEVLPFPETTRVPGAPPELVGITLVAGVALPVVDLRWYDPALRASARVRPRSSSPMLVCVCHGERVGFVGLEVVATGTFPTTDDGRVRLGEREIPVFDVGPVVSALRERRWAC